MKNNWIINSHITLVAAVGLLNSDNPGNGSSGCFLIRVTAYSKAAILKSLNANFCPVIAGEKSRAAVFKKQNDNPGSSPVKKKFSPVRFWKPSDDLQKLSDDLQTSPVVLQKYPANLQTSPVVLQKYPANLQTSPVFLQKYPANLQTSPVFLQKYSVDLQKLSVGLQKSPVELKTYCAIFEKHFDVLKNFPDNISPFSSFET